MMIALAWFGALIAISLTTALTIAGLVALGVSSDTAHLFGGAVGGTLGSIFLHWRGEP